MTELARRGRWDLDPSDATIDQTLQDIRNGEVGCDLHGKRARRLLAAPRRGQARIFLVWRLYYGEPGAIQVTRSAICGE